MSHFLLALGYDLVLAASLIALAPKMIYQRLTRGKYSNGMGQKLGIGFPCIDKGKRPLIWIHAVSFGETKAVAPLVRELKKKFNKPLIVISSTTETGHREAKKSIAIADAHVYLPFDFSWIINRMIKRIQPDLVLLTETDFWYNFLKSAKQGGAQVVLVNGKLSQRSMKRFRFLHFFSRHLFEKVDLFCIQSSHYLERFEQLHLEASRLVVTGNLKFDDTQPKVAPEELRRWRENLGIAANNQVVVVGSTHAPEEQLMMQVAKKLWQRLPHLKVILVPRHPERFDEVANIVAHKEGLPFVRLSQAQQKRGDEKVIIIDAMGLLRTCYQFADVAIVAGSYTPKVGGHNIIEPCWYGVPTLFGPHMKTQPALVTLVKQYQAGLQVAADELPHELERLLSDVTARQKYAAGGKRLIEESRGATERTEQAITAKLSSCPIFTHSDKMSLR